VFASGCQGSVADISKASISHSLLRGLAALYPGFVSLHTHICCLSPSAGPTGTV